MKTEYPEFYDFLADHLKPEHVPQTSQRFAAWMADADENGHIELSGLYTKTGNPVTGQFDELAY